MVSWTEVSGLFATNPHISFHVKPLSMNEVPLECDIFPMVSVVREDVPAPAPAPAPALAPALAPAQEPALVLAAEPASTASRKVLKLSKQTLDPIILGMDHADILYKDAPKMMKKEMEQTEARRIEGILSSLYTSQSGRSRGWSKALLETMIKPRCSSGGDLYELKQAKSVFVWQVVSSDKATSAVLDFLCVAKQIRVAIWSEESRRIVVFPAAEYVGDDARVGDWPLYNVSDTGHTILFGPMTSRELVTMAEKDSWTLLPPYSVIHSLEKLTLAELASVGTRLGMAEVVGSKVERIAALASYKLKSRLGA